MTAAAFLIGLLINFLIFLAAFFDEFAMPGPGAWLAIINVGILSIFLIRVYLWIFSKTLAFRLLARVVLHPLIAWKATWLLTVPSFVGGLAVAGRYHAFFQPPIDEWLFVGIFMLPAAFATWFSLVHYLSDIEDRNTPMKKAMARLGLLKPVERE